VAENGDSRRFRQQIVAEIGDYNRKRGQALRNCGCGLLFNMGWCEQAALGDIYPSYAATLSMTNRFQPMLV